MSGKLDEIIAFHKVLGAQYIVCSYPGHKTKPAVGGEHTFTLEDWHWNAERFNEYGAKVKAAGLRFGYHNHTPEFVAVDGVTPYDELMKLKGLLDAGALRTFVNAVVPLEQASKAYSGTLTNKRGYGKVVITVPGDE